ncbi:hypothetical protein [Nonomuraea insulae]|uniref:Uncharacterized protein n=1 Tax=Nonomuraea insulae TaxID=1616787 RepID=A0ABW1D5N3_9ACTN
MRQNLIVDPKLGRWWASRLEEEVGHWWVIMWSLHRQQFAAFYRSHWKEGGICRTGGTPHELWAHMREIQHEGRRQAMAAHAAVPPLLVEQLPDALWRAAG